MNDFCVEGLYLQKVADVTGIPVEYLAKLRDEGLLNERETRNKLIRDDCHALLKTGKFTASQICERIAATYNVSVSLVQTVLRVKPRRVFFCIRCGCEMRKSLYRRNGGVCEKCRSQSILV